MTKNDRVPIFVVVIHTSGVRLNESVFFGVAKLFEIIFYCCRFGAVICTRLQCCDDVSEFEANLARLMKEVDFNLNKMFEGNAIFRERLQLHEFKTISVENHKIHLLNRFHVTCWLYLSFKYLDVRL